VWRGVVLRIRETVAIAVVRHPVKRYGRYPIYTLRAVQVRMGASTYGKENPFVRCLDPEFDGRTAFDAEAEQPNHVRNAELGEDRCTKRSAEYPKVNQ